MIPTRGKSKLHEHFNFAHEPGEFACIVSDCNFVAPSRLAVLDHNKQVHKPMENSIAMKKQPITFNECDSDCNSDYDSDAYSVVDEVVEPSAKRPRTDSASGSKQGDVAHNVC